MEVSMRQQLVMGLWTHKNDGGAFYVYTFENKTPFFVCLMVGGLQEEEEVR